VGYRKEKAMKTAMQVIAIDTVFAGWEFRLRVRVLESYIPGKDG
jgi:hypothetical protein